MDLYENLMKASMTFFLEKYTYTHMLIHFFDCSWVPQLLIMGPRISCLKDITTYNFR